VAADAGRNQAALGKFMGLKTGKDYDPGTIRSVSLLLPPWPHRVATDIGRGDGAVVAQYHQREQPLFE